MPKKNKNFTSSPIPQNSDKSFDRYLNGSVSKATIDESLSEIFEDDNGKRINVKEVMIKPKRGFFTWMGIIAFYLIIIGALGAGAYYWFIQRGDDTNVADIHISAPDNLSANETFQYTIDYKNQEAQALEGLSLQLTYPDNFIFESSEPAATEGNNKWQLPDLRQFASGKVTVTGRMISPVGASNIVFADLSYHPAGYTSEFKKSASQDIVLKSSGFEMEATAPTSVLVGQDAELSVSYKPLEKTFIPSFAVHFPAMDNLEFPKADYGEDIEMTEPGTFNVKKFKEEKKDVAFKFKFNDKKNDTETLKISFSFKDETSGKEYVFEERSFDIEIVKNSLNLTLSANGEASDQGIDFGETINYSISYVNKGEQPMNDVIIMAVLDGEALDWRKLVDANNGKVTGRTIVWTKDEVPELKALSKNQEGNIQFTIPVRAVNESSLIRSFEIKSYAQFALGGKSEELSSDNENNRSNQLTIKLNSDVSLDEAVRYFDEDNIAVGTGPLPPQAGQTTTFKVYWKITNSLHELAGLKVTTKLPDYVEWDGKDQADAGTLEYNQDTNEVNWMIGRLPLSAASVQAQFSISLKPRASDRNKLLVLVSGTSLEGNDNQTSYAVSQILKAQTTKLEKDDIADTTGIIQ